MAVVRYNRKRNVHGNRRAVQRPCLTPDAASVHVPLPINLGESLALQEAADSFLRTDSAKRGGITNSLSGTKPQDAVTAEIMAIVDDHLRHPLS